MDERFKFDEIDADLYASNVYACRRGYAETKKKGKHVMLHRVIAERMFGEISDYQIDHINNDKLDNRRCNLRLATKALNMMNRPKQANNKTGHKNIHYRESRGSYILQVRHGEKRITRESKNIVALIELRDSWLDENVKEWKNNG